jgi:hypothetical protein
VQEEPVVRQQHRPTEAIQFLVPLRLQAEALVVTLPILRMPVLPAALVAVRHLKAAAVEAAVVLLDKVTVAGRVLIVRRITGLAAVAVRGLLVRMAPPQKVEMAALVWHQALAAHR